MSENDKDNKDFEFIQEQIIEKKSKKYKKWFIDFLMLIVMAGLFGIIAAVTFCITEPRLYKLLQREEEDIPPVNFPTEYPEEDNIADPTNTKDTTVTEGNNSQAGTINPVPSKQGEQGNETVIIENKIDADTDDYVNMYEDIKNIVFGTNKSLVTVSSIIGVKDMFGNSINLKIDTTGVVIWNNNTDLLILVSLDRVKDANSIKIELSNSISVDAEIRNYESELNLAVIAVHIKDIPESDRNNIKVATLGESYTVSVGNPIIALGSPNGHPNSMELGFITSEGSSVSITDNRLDLFNTNLRDNEYSDGIIINMRGEIIGLITRTLKEGVNEELSTVIGISKLKAIIGRMANKEPRIYCGVKTEDLTESAKKEHNVENGIYVTEVKTNSPAYEAGIKNGDIILQVDDTNVLHSSNFYTTISSYQPGKKIKVKIKRTATTNEREMTLEITLKEKEK